MNTPEYLAPDYFPPDYFGMGWEEGSLPAGAGHDWHVMQDIQSRLLATGEFDGVHLTGPPTYLQVASAEDVTAWLQLTEWDEDDLRDDPYEVEVTRKVRWSLTIAVRHGDAVERDRLLSRLTAVCQNATNGKSLGGITIPGWTKLRRGRFEEPKAPERRTIMTGEFVYLIHGFSGHYSADV